MWTKIDDRFYSHPKIVRAWALDPASVGLYVRALSYATSNLTDGQISQALVFELFRSRTRRARAVKALIETGLWEQTGDGYAIHDYLDFNTIRANRSSGAAGQNRAESRENHDPGTPPLARAHGCARPQPCGRARAQPHGCARPRPANPSPSKRQRP